MKRGPTVPPAGRRAAIGSRWGPGGPVGPPKRAQAWKGSEHQLCTDMGQSSDPSDDYKPRAALEGTNFGGAKADKPQKKTHFGALL